jgi:hypothetical protein
MRIRIRIQESQSGADLYADDSRIFLYSFDMCLCNSMSVISELFFLGWTITWPPFRCCAWQSSVFFWYGLEILFFYLTAQGLDSFTIPYCTVNQVTIRYSIFLRQLHTERHLKYCTYPSAVYCFIFISNFVI